MGLQRPPSPSSDLETYSIARQSAARLLFVLVVGATAKQPTDEKKDKKRVVE